MEVSIAEKIGQYTCYQRKKKKYSINEFAKICSIDPSFLMRLENGKYKSIKLDYVQKISIGFAIPLEKFLEKSKVIPRKIGIVLPEIEFYLKEKYQLPDTAINDLKLFLLFIVEKYKDDIKDLKQKHKKYWGNEDHIS